MEVKINCTLCGLVAVGYEEYAEQLDLYGRYMFCPDCGNHAELVGLFKPCCNPSCSCEVNIKNFACPKCGRDQAEDFR